MTDDEELAAIRVEKAQLESVISSANEQKYASDDEELEAIRAEKAQIENQLKSSGEKTLGYDLAELAFSPFPELRGMAKTAGGLMDLDKTMSPNNLSATDYAKTAGNFISKLIRTP